MDEEAGRFFVELMRGIWQDRAIAQMESYIHDTPEVRNVPDPNTCHPAFSHAAKFVREFNRGHVRISMVRSAPAYMEDVQPCPESPTNDHLVLSRKKACGPAPFVGDPLINEAVYTWSIWVDNQGRYISGDSELFWRTR